MSTPEYVRGRFALPFTAHNRFSAFPVLDSGWKLGRAPGSVPASAMLDKILEWSSDTTTRVTMPDGESLRWAMARANQDQPVELNPQWFPTKSGWILLPERVTILTGLEPFGEVLMPTPVQMLRWHWVGRAELVITAGDAADDLLLAEGWKAEGVTVEETPVRCRGGSARLLAALMHEADSRDLAMAA